MKCGEMPNSGGDTVEREELVMPKLFRGIKLEDLRAQPILLAGVFVSKFLRGMVVKVDYIGS